MEIGLHVEIDSCDVAWGRLQDQGDSTRYLSELAYLAKASLALVRVCENRAAWRRESHSSRASAKR